MNGRSLNYHPIPNSQTFIIEIDWRESSRSPMFLKIGLLKNFTIFTEKHLSWSLFLIKLLALETHTHLFSCEYCKILNSSFYIEHPGGCSSGEKRSPIIFISVSNASNANLQNCAKKLGSKIRASRPILPLH